MSPNHRKSLKSDILSSFSYLFYCASSLVPSCSYPSRRAPSSLFVQVSLCFLLRTSRSNVRRTFFTGVKKGSKGSSSLANRERKKNAARVSSTVTLSGELWSVRRFRLCSIQWKRKREGGRVRERGGERRGCFESDRAYNRLKEPRDCSTFRVSTSRKSKNELRPSLFGLLEKLNLWNRCSRYGITFYIMEFRFFFPETLWDECRFNVALHSKRVFPVISDAIVWIS